LKTDDFLQNEGAKYRSLIESTGAGFVILDSQGVVMDADQGYLKLTGFQKIEDIIGKSVIEWTAEEDRERNAREVGLCLEQGYVHDLRVRYRHPDGTVVPVELNASMIKAKNGPIILTLCRDATERVKTEELAQQRERFLEDVFTSIQDGVSILNRDLNIVRVNKAMETWYAASMPLLGKKCYQAYHNSAAICRDCPTMKAFDSGHTEHTTVPGLKDSAAQWVEVFSYPIKDPATGGVTGAVEFVRDITKAKITEEALLASEHKYRELVDLLPQTVFETDDRGRFTYANNFGYTLFGYTEEEVKKNGFTILDLLAPEDREICGKRFAETMKGKMPDPQNYSGIKKNGERLPFTVYTTPIHRDGVVSGLRGILIDMTDFRRIETEKQELTEKLRQAEKLHAIGELAGGIAHDFNNQLTGIISCADLLKSDSEIEKRPDHVRKLDIILKSAERAATLTGQLLAFARKGNFVSVPVNVHGLIEDVIGLLSHSIDKRISIDKALAPEPLYIRGDPALVESAILNIAINARDAMMNGGKLVFRAGVEELDDEKCRKSMFDIKPGSYCSVSVSDTGHGMDEETLSRIFEPFFTTKKERGGSGMGLASVYGTMKSLRGSVFVKSRPGEGTSFTLYFPYDSGLKPGTEKSAGSSPPASGKGAILLADDEGTVRASVSDMLGYLGYAVTACVDGEQCVSEFRKNPGKYRIVILDMVMPKKNGEEAFRELRSLDPSIGIVLISGYSVNLEIQKMLRDGQTVFLKKPFKLADLKETVASVLKS